MVRAQSLRSPPEVIRFKAGDRVAGYFFQNWVAGRPNARTRASALGSAANGMLADYVVLEEDGAVLVPAHLSLEEAATVPCAAVTAWNVLVEHVRLVAGQSVLVQGTGGVSIFALQLARMMGALVIATSSSDAKLARAQELGAAHGVNYKTTPEWDKAALELTGSQGVDQVIEIGGADTFTRSLGSLRIGGKISLLGVLTRNGQSSALTILAKRANVQGIQVRSMQIFEDMNRAITVNRLKPVIDSIFPFEEAPAAYLHLLSATHFGKIVIKVA